MPCRVCNSHRRRVSTRAVQLGRQRDVHGMPSGHVWVYSRPDVTQLHGPVRWRPARQQSPAGHVHLHRRVPAGVRVCAGVNQRHSSHLSGMWQGVGLGYLAGSWPESWVASISVLSTLRVVLSGLYVTEASHTSVSPLQLPLYRVYPLYPSPVHDSRRSVVLCCDVLFLLFSSSPPGGEVLPCGRRLLHSLPTWPLLYQRCPSRGVCGHVRGWDVLP